MPGGVDFTKALAAVAEWAKGLPDADAIADLSKHLFERSEATGLEHMLHAPAPPLRTPAFQVGTPSSVHFRPDAWDPTVWSAANPETAMHPGFGHTAYSLHTHPGNAGGMDPELAAYIRSLEGPAWQPPADLRPQPKVEFPWFSPADVSVEHRIAQTQRPGGLRAAIGTGQGSFLGYGMRGVDPWDPEAYKHLDAQMNTLRNLGMGADQRLRQTPGAVADWHAQLARTFGGADAPQGLSGPGPALLGNLQATAPFYKTAGDVVDLTSHMVNPEYDAAMQEYLKATGMAAGGAV
jgi:hypothetical protein